MRQSMFIARLRGYVRLELRGRGGEAMINEMLATGLSAWDIQPMQDERLRLCVPVGEFFELKPLLKRTGCRMHVLERRGLPFFLDKLGRRKLFFAGGAGFLLGMFLLSSLVWQVSVEGNERIAQADVMRAAEQLGIHRFQWKFKLPQTEELAHGIQAALPQAAWVGVEVRGTHVHIKVVEATIPQKPELMNPRNLVASKNALVTEIMAEKGRPLVQPNAYVRKGDVLISGKIGDEENYQVVVASGKVKGIVWYTSQIEVPLTQTFKTYTGESKERSYLVFGSRALQVTGYGKLAFEQHETLTERKTLSWLGYTLPVGWMHEKLMEVRQVEQPVELAQARQSGLEQARSRLLAAAGPESRIAGEKILHEKSENGKVYMKVHFEVEETISEEQPIVVQGE
ncbi:sporulation protein YqfD [Paenibacillus athensensis]|uniref:Sporulation protein YqfD n=1 Tax=Paenibacillus athensensis TaxID=1967502 RepID=A0A4Y8PSQ0_9BACL|nr:sporulation protein YqfD [Paenibacillus athensensis]MCD1261573.1 sporulation protein YqfD [Paenibacillus athensensis]